MAGSVDVYSQTRNPVVQASVWATPKKFGETNSVAELIQEATYDFAGLNPFPITVSNLPRYPVHLAEVTVWQLPRAIKGDPAKLARTLILLSLVYDIKK